MKKNINIDKKIKDSFETLNKKAPQKSWDLINRQLIIDKTWKNIFNELNMSGIYRIMKYAAVILLILSISFSGIKYFSNKNEILSNKHDVNTIREQNTNIIEEKDVIKNQEDLYSINDENKSNKKDILTNVTIPPNTADNAGNSDSENKGQKSKENNKIIVINNGKEDTELQHKNNLIATSDNVNKINYKKIVLDIKPGGIYIDVAKPYFNKSYEETKSSGLLAGEFELGVFYSYTNTLIYNNETRLGLDEKSLTNMASNYEHVYGIIASYNFNTKNSLLTQIHIKEGAKQNFTKYENGYLNNKQLELNYFKISLLYQRNIYYNTALPVKFFIRTGVYYSFLKSANETVNDATISKYNDYLSYDFGLEGMLGLRNETNRFIIEYGLRSEYGLVNIFSGTDKMNSDLNKTNIINTGIFVTLKIKINKNTFGFQPLGLDKHL